MQCATSCRLLHPLTTTRAPGYTLDGLQVGLREALLIETPKKKNLGVVALTDDDPRRDHRAVMLGSSPFVPAAQGPRQAIAEKVEEAWADPGPGAGNRGANDPGSDPLGAVSGRGSEANIC